MNQDERPHLRWGAGGHDAPRGVRFERVTVAPKTWWGKLLALVAGVVAAVAAFFVSLLALAVVVGVGVAVAIYVWWTTRHARRAMRDQTIEGVVSRREVD